MIRASKEQYEQVPPYMKTHIIGGTVFFLNLHGNAYYSTVCVLSPEKQTSNSRVCSMLWELLEGENCAFIKHF
jgi:hypothetical protein